MWVSRPKKLPEFRQDNPRDQFIGIWQSLVGNFLNLDSGVSELTPEIRATLKRDLNYLRALCEDGLNPHGWPDEICCTCGENPVKKDGRCIYCRISDHL